MANAPSLSQQNAICILALDEAERAESSQEEGQYGGKKSGCDRTVPLVLNEGEALFVYNNAAGEKNVYIFGSRVSFSGKKYIKNYRMLNKDVRMYYYIYVYPFF
jgi:hypothetical protein